jgi:diguanylate cyclase (GGDEF)-like protein/PAS domain S-box-containing protein
MKDQPGQTTPEEPATLHRQADAQLEHQPMAGMVLTPPTAAEAQRMVHELQVHQIELELQNQALQEARHQLEQSLENYTNLYDFAPAAYLTLTDSGSIRRLNLAAAVLLGEDRAALVGRRFGLFVAARSRPAFNDFLRRMAAGVSNETSEITLVAAGDPASASAPVEGAQVQLQGVGLTYDGERLYRIVLLDMTERRKMEERLRASEEKFRSLVETTSDCIWELDAQGRFTYLSPKFQDMTGYAPAEFLGRSPLDILPEDGVQETREQMSTMIAAQQPFSTFQQPVLHREGRRMTVEVSGIPLISADGQCHGWRGITRDITERKRLEGVLIAARETAARYASELRLGVLVEQGLAGVVETDLDGRLLRVNDCYGELVGHTRETLLGRHLSDLISSEDWSRVQRLFERLLRGERAGIIEHGYSHPDARMTYAQATFALLRDDQDRPVGFMGLTTDITELRQAEEQFRRMTDVAHDAILMMNPAGAISYWNPAATAILGYSTEQALGRNLHALLAPERYQAAYHAAFPAFQHSGQGRAVNKTLELSATRRDGCEITVELSLAAVRLKDGWNAIGILRDITARKQAEQALRDSERRFRELNADLEHQVEGRTIELRKANAILRQLAITDDLTEVWNRRHLEHVGEVEIARAQRYGEPLSLVMFDIDYFKSINDDFGHQTGDQVLIELTRLVRSNLRATDVLGRWGGDEFVVILPHCGLPQAASLVEKLRALIATQPFPPIGRLTVSFGLSERGSDEGFEAWLKRADDALYAAKAAGRNCARLAP